MGLSIVDKDKGFNALIGSVEELKRKDDHVVVGLPYGQDTNGKQDGIRLIDYAVANEFGATIHHPGGTSYGYKNQRDAKAGKVRFLKAGTGYMELGVTKPHTITIPPRPFIRNPFDNSKEKLIKAAEQLLGKVIVGTIDKHTALEVLGDTLLKEIRLSIERPEYEPNAPSTIRAKKGKDKPLVDSGRLQQSLKYEVR